MEEHIRLRIHHGGIKLALKYAFIALSFNSFLSAQTESTNTPYLNMLIEDAINSDSWLTANKEQQNSYESLSHSAQSWPDPRISLGANNFPTDSFDFNQEAMSQFSIGITQMFPKGQTLALQSKQYETRAYQMPLERENRAAMLRKEVSVAWLSALKFQKSIEIAEQSSELLKQMKDIIDSRYLSSYGIIKQQDLTWIDLEVGRLEDRITKLRQEQFAAISQLSQYVSLQDNQVDIDSSELEKITHLLKRPLPIQDIVTNLSRHPSILAYDHRIKLLDLDRDLANQQYKPEWGVTLSYGYRGEDLLGNERSDLVSAAVSLSVPIFSNKRVDSKVLNAVAMTSVMSSDRELLLNRLESKVRFLYSNINHLDKRLMDYKETLLPTYAKNSEIFMNAYTSNQGEISAVLLARISELNAKLEQLSIQVDRLQNLVELQYFSTISSRD